MGTTPATVCVVFPTCNSERAATAAARWHAQGYQVAVWAEGDLVVPSVDLVVRAEVYPGYFAVVNHLARRAIGSGADVVVAIGDDMDPDPSKTAQVIAAEYLEHFPGGGFGVMQPTGDDPKLLGTDRICGSPWYGKAWVEQAYRGSGPEWAGYNQFFGDEELQCVAKNLGVLWQRPDLTQFHHHWMRYGLETMTSYQKANNAHWKHDEDLFRQRKKDGFSGSERLTIKEI